MCVVYGCVDVLMSDIMFMNMRAAYSVVKDTQPFLQFPAVFV